MFKRSHDSDGAAELLELHEDPDDGSLTLIPRDTDGLTEEQIQGRWIEVEHGLVDLEALI